MQVNVAESVVAQQIDAWESQWPELRASEWFRSRPSGVQALVERYPQWRFYRKREPPHHPVRVYGVVERKNCRYALHAFVAHALTPIVVIDGVDADDIEPVDRWSDADLRVIRPLGPENQRVFLEPHGFTALVEMHRAAVE